MSRVIAIMSISLDGYVAGPNDEVGEVDRTPVTLGNPAVIAGVGVTHLRYRVHNR